MAQRVVVLVVDRVLRSVRAESVGSRERTERDELPVRAWVIPGHDPDAGHGPARHGLGLAGNPVANRGLRHFGRCVVRERRHDDVANRLDGWVGRIQLLNPWTPLFESYRDVIYNETMPNWLWLFALLLASTIFLGLAMIFFKRVEPAFGRAA